MIALKIFIIIKNYKIVYYSYQLETNNIKVKNTAFIIKFQILYFIPNIYKWVVVLKNKVKIHKETLRQFKHKANQYNKFKHLKLNNLV